MLLPAPLGGGPLRLLLILPRGLQIPTESITWHLARDKTVADGLLELAKLKDADTLVCGISGYRWVGNTIGYSSCLALLSPTCQCQLVGQ